MTHLFLAHLSENNNTPERVQELFDGVKGRTDVVIASRYRETGVYQIGGDKPGKWNAVDEASQLSLF